MKNVVIRTSENIWGTDGTIIRKGTELNGKLHEGIVTSVNCFIPTLDAEIVFYPGSTCEIILRPDDLECDLEKRINFLRIKQKEFQECGLFSGAESSHLIALLQGPIDKMENAIMNSN
ncbi:hypothetical protein [Altibacter sp. HG106]|uniref:hypothetical protein n=1 Tax=Altibacter sp. HG106 TaxID=3023937 RepID=UPI00235089D5|nr:hypothetical protein [Altibacter sp. HG106]MDC7994437.1 hypothetical protein [Altibacter sp. HG106]